MPEAGTLESAFRRAWRLAHLQEAIDRAAREATDDEVPAMPAGLPDRIADGIKGTGKPWDVALWEWVRDQRSKLK